MDTTYTTIFADPAWRYKDKLRMEDTDRSSVDHYQTMTVDEICDLGHPRGDFIAEHRIAEDALLFLCVTNPFLLDGSGIKVCEAWGFNPSQLITWVKGRIQLIPPRDGCHDLPDPDLVLQIGMGHLFRSVTEHVIVATRGKVKKLVMDKGVLNLVLATRGKHSAKPAELYALIERLAPGPRIEMFARERRAGWDASGIGVDDTVYVRTPQPTQSVLPPPDAVCVHGTALDMHCCNCHTGFIFDTNHECPPRAPWDHDIEWP